MSGKSSYDQTKGQQVTTRSFQRKILSYTTAGQMQVGVVRGHLGQDLNFFT